MPASPAGAHPRAVPVYARRWSPLPLARTHLIYGSVCAPRDGRGACIDYRRCERGTMGCNQRRVRRAARRERSRLSLPALILNRGSCGCLECLSGIFRRLFVTRCRHRCYLATCRPRTLSGAAQLAHPPVSRREIFDIARLGPRGTRCRTISSSTPCATPLSFILQPRSLHPHNDDVTACAFDLQPRHRDSGRVLARRLSAAPL